MKSMTGYGRGSNGRGNNKIGVIIRSVNSRQLDLKIRGLDQYPEEENRVRELVKNKIDRGTVLVYVELPKSIQSGTTPVFNRTRFEAINSILLEIQKEYGRHLELSDILSTSDLFDLNHSYNINQKSLDTVITDAIKMLDDMQTKEGEKIANDFKERILKLNEFINKIEKLSASSSKEKIQNYKEKITALLSDIKIDENRVAQEIVIHSEKSDISEEIVRCKSHFSQILDFISMEEATGKRLLFLLQEIGREVNTIGAKCGNIEMTKLVVEMKNELEKIREQAQNIQ